MTKELSPEHKAALDSLMGALELAFPCKCFLCGEQAKPPIAAQHVPICDHCAEQLRLRVLP